jgi:hypothetical protein
MLHSITLNLSHRADFFFLFSFLDDDAWEIIWNGQRTVCRLWQTARPEYNQILSKKGQERGNGFIWPSAPRCNRVSGFLPILYSIGWVISTNKLFKCILIDFLDEIFQSFFLVSKHSSYRCVDWNLTPWFL